MELRIKVSEIKSKIMSGMSFEEAKIELQPHIDLANERACKIARKFGKKFKKLTFGYIMR